MKKSLLTSLVILFLTSWVIGQVNGVLTVTATTSATGGNYAPKNIVAIWIENEQGNFVKTLMAYAATRKTHLNTWEASTTAAGSPFNVVDAITGSTRSSHAVRTCTWNATNVNGVVVPDGIYKVRMELTDKNNTGNYSTFTFTKGGDPVTLTPANVPSFSSISIVWEPNTISVGELTADKLCRIYPNPTTGKFDIEGESIRKVEIWNTAGSLVQHCNSSEIDLSGEPNGVYFVKISTDKGFVTKKVMLER